MDAKRALVRKWLVKARRDLLSAKRLARGSDPYLDAAIYHCQQCVEKAVKGWLVYHDQPFRVRSFSISGAALPRNARVG
jgi:HEPN domain-containing protein